MPPDLTELLEINAPPQARTTPSCSEQLLLGTVGCLGWLGGNFALLTAALRLIGPTLGPAFYYTGCAAPLVMTLAAWSFFLKPGLRAIAWGGTLALGLTILALIALFLYLAHSHVNWIM